MSVQARLWRDPLCLVYLVMFTLRLRTSKLYLYVNTQKVQRFGTRQDRQDQRQMASRPTVSIQSVSGG
jgi:hypothetical protein